MLRLMVLFVVSSALVLATGAAAAAEPVATHLQDISVTIRAGQSQGSGIIVCRALRDGNATVPVNLVWTAAHVVSGLRQVETVIDPKTGRDRKVVSFRDAAIVQEFREKGRRVGESRLDVKVLKYSKAEDLALLMVRKTGYTAKGVVFYLDPGIPPIGTDLYHVGSMGGQELGATSMTQGIVAQIGRVLGGKTYEQVTCAASGGSSGGGVFLRDGRCVGILTMGVRGADNFNFIVPVRRMLKWGKRTGLLWALDSRIASPSLDAVQGMPVEDGASSSGRPAPPDGHVFRISQVAREADRP